MGQFMVTIVFHTTRDKALYEKAKNMIRTEGFLCEINLRGKWFLLPIGQFYINGSFTISQIFEKAKTSISTLNNDFGIMVTEIQEVDFYNLLPSYSSKLR